MHILSIVNWTSSIHEMWNQKVRGRAYLFLCMTKKVSNKYEYDQTYIIWSIKCIWCTKVNSLIGLSFLFHQTCNLDSIKYRIWLAICNTQNSSFSCWTIIYSRTKYIYHLRMMFQSCFCRISTNTSKRWQIDFCMAVFLNTIHHS